MSKIKNIRQHDSRDCGAACLCMISEYYGAKYSIQYLSKLLCINQEGASIWGIIEGAKKIGLSAVSYKGAIEKLKKFTKEKKEPFILHLKKNHFVVISKTDKTKVKVNDPAYGNYMLTWEELEKEWSGYIITFSVNDDFKEGNYKENKYEIFRTIIKKIRNICYGVLAYQ